jgi:chromosome segregation ATPase
MMADTRDEQIQELSEDLKDRDARIGQLEGQIQEHDMGMGKRDAMIEFLEEHFHDLNIELEDANEHIEMHHVQQVAQHAPLDAMDVDGDEEPHEMEGVSEIDYEVGSPLPPPQGAQSPVRSESSVNDLDDF